MTDASAQTSRTPLRNPLDVGGVLAVVVSIAVSVFAYGTLPDQIRIHWSLGGPYYGPEFASPLLVLVTFPLLVAGFFVGSRWLRAYHDQIEEFNAVRLLYSGCALLMLIGVVLVQFVIIWANLG